MSTRHSTTSPGALQGPAVSRDAIRSAASELVAAGFTPFCFHEGGSVPGPSWPTLTWEKVSAPGWDFGLSDAWLPLGGLAIRVGPNARRDGSWLVHLESDSLESDGGDPLPGVRELVALATDVLPESVGVDDVLGFEPGTLCWWSRRGLHLVYRVSDALGAELFAGFGAARTYLPAPYSRIDFHLGGLVDGVVKGACARVPPSPGRSWEGDGLAVADLSDSAALYLEIMADEVADVRAERAAAVLGMGLSASHRLPAGWDDPDPAWAARLARAVAACLRAFPAAVSGCRGHDATLAAACRVVEYGILDPNAVLRWLLAEYNPRCAPPWTVDELAHKAREAVRLASPDPVVLGRVRKDYEAARRRVAVAGSFGTESAPPCRGAAERLAKYGGLG